MWALSCWKSGSTHAYTHPRTISTPILSTFYALAGAWQLVIAPPHITPLPMSFQKALCSPFALYAPFSGNPYLFYHQRNCLRARMRAMHIYYQNCGESIELDVLGTGYWMMRNELQLCRILYSVYCFCCFMLRCFYSLLFVCRFPGESLHKPLLQPNRFGSSGSTSSPLLRPPLIRPSLVTSLWLTTGGNCPGSAHPRLPSHMDPLLHHESLQIQHHRRLVPPLPRLY